MDHLLCVQYVTALGAGAIAEPAYRRSGIRKAKTDLLDAFWIADFLRIGNLRPTDQDLPVIHQPGQCPDFSRLPIDGFQKDLRRTQGARSQREQFDIEALFTRSDGSYLAARWGRPAKT